MCSWHIKIILIASLFLNAQCHAFFQNSTEWRTIYIAPGDDDYSLADCPVDHCFYLQNVFSNSSYFFHSHTTLELLSGVYNITEQVGQLVLTNVNNFKLKGSSSKVTHIACQPGATLGLIVVHAKPKCRNF